MSQMAEGQPGDYILQQFLFTVYAQSRESSRAITISYNQIWATDFAAFSCEHLLGLLCSVYNTHWRVNLNFLEQVCHDQGMDRHA